MSLIDALVSFGAGIGAYLPALVLLGVGVYFLVNPAVAASLLVQYQAWGYGIYAQERPDDVAPAGWLVRVVRLVALGLLATGGLLLVRGG
jgi:hypothetical protein